MTEQEFREWIRVAIRGIGAEYRELLDEETKQPQATVVDRLLRAWRRVSEEERAEFLRQANRDEQTRTP